jgi:hypothetical protein
MDSVLRSTGVCQPKGITKIMKSSILSLSLVILYKDYKVRNRQHVSGLRLPVSTLQVMGSFIDMHADHLLYIQCWQETKAVCDSIHFTPDVDSTDSVVAVLFLTLTLPLNGRHRHLTSAVRSSSLSGHHNLDVSHQKHSGTLRCY